MQWFIILNYGSFMKERLEQFKKTLHMNLKICRKHLLQVNINLTLFILNHQLVEHRQMRQMTDSDGCPFYAKE